MIPHSITVRAWLMSLRAKLIAFFCALAVVPFGTLGVYDYFHSIRALDDLIASQTQVVATRAAEALLDRYALRQSDLLLLAENAETRRLFEAHQAHDSVAFAAAMTAAAAYLQQAWALLGRSYETIVFRDRSGAVLYRLGEAQARPGSPAEPRYGLSGTVPLAAAVPGADLRHPRGEVLARVRAEALFPLDALDARFGRQGYSLVLDRATGRILYYSRRQTLHQAGAMFGPEQWRSDSLLLRQASGSFKFSEGDTTRVAAFTSLPTPPWTVVTTGAVDEFSAPFLHMRFANLILVLLVTALATLAFVLMTRRATRSLEALTRAADEVGKGNFAPVLPAPRRDEVGRLSTAFGAMARKIGETVHELETSRHMAAVGRFAAQLSHEIRNPLTSLKLNLQSMARDAEAGTLPSTTTRPIQISLREIERLDRVARGALRLGRGAEGPRVRCSVHDVASEALDVVRSQLEQQGVHIATSFGATDDTVCGDPEALQGAFLNLFLNAAEAMPDGGTLTVESLLIPVNGRPSPIVRVRVCDTGPGVPAEAREKIFEPFFSTKPQGTGFGLSVALRTIEELGGRLGLEPAESGAQGATFVIELPLASEETS